jgi:hypothetical protein
MIFSDGTFPVEEHAEIVDYVSEPELIVRCDEMRCDEPLSPPSFYVIHFPDTARREYENTNVVDCVPVYNRRR